MSKEIILSQGKVALVDDEDYEWLNQWKWWFNSRGYAHRIIYENGKQKGHIYMHRLILNTPSDLDVDHINHDGLDNRRSNLRQCTRSQNLANQKMRKINTSGKKGVSWHKTNKKWSANIGFNHKLIHIGYFDNICDASIAYKNKAHELYGDFIYEDKSI
jgi:hypothetical protein